MGFIPYFRGDLIVYSFLYPHEIVCKVPAVPIFRSYPIRVSLAIYFGWRFELTEQGLVKTRSLKEKEVETVDVSLNYKDYLIISLLVMMSVVAVNSDHRHHYK